MQDSTHRTGSSAPRHGLFLRAIRSLRGWSMIGGAVSLTTLVLVIAWPARPAPAETTPGANEIDAALADTTAQLMKNSAAPQDPDEVREAAANLFVILNPDLANRERRKDPAFVAREAAAAAIFLNPGVVHAKRMRDPQYRQKYQAAMDSFAEEARKADAPIPPSATDAGQIEALRNDPAWRRQREAPIQALLP